MLRVVENTRETKGEEGPFSLDALAREGARRMLEQALEQEVAAYIERHRGERDEDGRALVVRYGKARRRR